MRESGLRCVLFAHEQAADKADVVLLDSYHFFIVSMLRRGNDIFLDAPDLFAGLCAEK